MAAPVKLSVWGIFLIFLSLTLIDAAKDEFHEELFIKPLDSGHLYNHFQFTTTWDVDLYDTTQFQHYRLFPKSLGEVLAKYHVQELHLSQTQGRWRHSQWGYPVHDAPTGAQLWVWFKPDTPNVDTTWLELINVLSGQFCASLNFMDGRGTVSPRLSFRPHGVATERYDRRSSTRIGAGGGTGGTGGGAGGKGSLLRYAVLPSELVCTENLTPWKKLLPCGVKSGLSTLFNALKMYDASYSSLGLHFRPLCRDSACNATTVELSQSLAVVFEPPVTGTSGWQDWSLKKQFSKIPSTSCPLASSSRIYVDLSTNRSADYHFTLSPEPAEIVTVKRGGSSGPVSRCAVYDVPAHLSRAAALPLAAKYSSAVPYSRVPPPVLHAHRFQTGYGQETGGVATLLYNEHSRRAVTVTVLEVLPWYLRPYFHTLRAEAFHGGPDYAGQNGTTLKPLHVHYEPGKARQRPHMLEVVLTLPAQSVTRLSWQFERALLKWTEYPPDANHGFYVPAAIISAVLPSPRNYTAGPQWSSTIRASLEDEESKGWFVRIHTESLLITLPTPDFSMPYNVICLACTVVAIAFGSMHNLTTRRFVVLDPKKKQGMLAKLKAKLFGKKQEEEKAESDAVEEKEEEKKEELEEEKQEQEVTVVKRKSGKKK